MASTVSTFKGQSEPSLRKDGVEKVQKDCNLCSSLEFINCYFYYLFHRAVVSKWLNSYANLICTHFYYLMLPFHTPFPLFASIIWFTHLSLHDVPSI